MSLSKYGLTGAEMKAAFMRPVDHLLEENARLRQELDAALQSENQIQSDMARLDARCLALRQALREAADRLVELDYRLRPVTEGGASQARACANFLRKAAAE